jgi:hypothetical protein
MDVRAAILDAVARSGRSEREISIAATGHDTAIRDLKKSGSANLRTVAKLCEQLALELYVGPPRHLAAGPLPPDVMDMISRAAAASPLSLDRLVRALELTEAGLAAARKTLPPTKKAELVAAVYEVLTLAPDNEEAARRIVRLAA